MAHPCFCASLPRLDQIRPDQAALLAGVRTWVRARQHGACPLRAAADRLGSDRAARGLHLLLETVGACWPERFAVAAPCCAQLTHDEATLLAMIVLAGSARRAPFDALLCEMLADDARERLYATSRALATTLDT
jgi:hypothetical protein